MLGDTVLSVANAHGHSDIVEMLLCKGDDISQRVPSALDGPAKVELVLYQQKLEEKEEFKPNVSQILWKIGLEKIFWCIQRE